MAMFVKPSLANNTVKLLGWWSELGWVTVGNVVSIAVFEAWLADRMIQVTADCDLAESVSCSGHRLEAAPQEMTPFCFPPMQEQRARVVKGWDGEDLA